MLPLHSLTGTWNRQRILENNYLTRQFATFFSDFFFIIPQTIDGKSHLVSVIAKIYKNIDNEDEKVCVNYG